MYSRSWLIIRDDKTKTFEVCGQESNTDHFTNMVHGMQRHGMLVTAVLLPVTNKFSNKQGIQQTGFRPEEGLYDRLMKDYQDRVKGDLDDWEE